MPENTCLNYVIFYTLCNVLHNFEGYGIDRNTQIWVGDKIQTGYTKKFVALMVEFFCLRLLFLARDRYLIDILINKAAIGEVYWSCASAKSNLKTLI